MVLIPTLTNRWQHHHMTHSALVCGPLSWFKSWSVSFWRRRWRENANVIISITSVTSSITTSIYLHWGGLMRTWDYSLKCRHSWFMKVSVRLVCESFHLMVLTFEHFPLCHLQREFKHHQRWHSLQSVQNVFQNDSYIHSQQNNTQLTSEDSWQN